MDNDFKKLILAKLKTKPELQEVLLSALQENAYSYRKAIELKTNCELDQALLTSLMMPSVESWDVNNELHRSSARIIFKAMKLKSREYTSFCGIEQKVYKFVIDVNKFFKEESERHFHILYANEI